MHNYFKSAIRAVLFVIAIGVGGFQTVATALANAPQIPVELAFEILQSEPETLVLDVRTPGEYHGDLGHLKGAVNIDFRDIPEALAAGADLFDIPKSTRILIHCHTDMRAGVAAKSLRDAGFSNISIIDDGIVGWHRANLPVVYTTP